MDNYSTFHLDTCQLTPEVSQPKEKTASIIDGHNLKLNDKGIDYYRGIGCSRHDNCFTCPFTDCKFQSTSKIYDLKMLSNKGDGIKVW